MTNDRIGKFIESKANLNNEINIHFKGRETLKAVFIRTDDYDELKEKNYWRIVAGKSLEEWKRTGEKNLERIFNGAIFIRLSA